MYLLHVTTVTIELTKKHTSLVTALVSLFILLPPNEDYENENPLLLHAQFFDNLLSKIRWLASLPSISMYRQSLCAFETGPGISQFFQWFFAMVSFFHEQKAYNLYLE